ncbi:methyltransferase [Vineibacter terrae]|uniref:Methyltransferase n=1 Tax=Vineibacter terrae TaxID=2586908 RepID=A0A5C8PE29_9HYPH|nr:methyltransferase [Vineibacter terrae]TXL72021.1 methyltransferase [Vineibacter terrae]
MSPELDTCGAGRAGLDAEPFADCTDDRLLGGRVRLLQPARGYRVAIDAVLLAASVPVASGQRIIDVGCGVGAAALCLLARAAASGLSGVDAVGLDVQPRFVALARCNAERNGVAGAMTVVEGDVASAPDLGLFDRVMTNPPYLSAAHADPPPDRSKALATVESTANLAAWLGFCRRLLRPGGTLSLVHRADRRAELLRLLRPLAADIAVLPLLPQAGAAPRRLLIRARQGTGGQVRDLPGLVLHRKAGGYTPEAEAILRDLGSLDLG